MYNNDMINKAINETLGNIKSNIGLVPVGLGLINSDYRVSVFDNDSRYYEYRASGMTGCDDSTERLMKKESDYYELLICALTGLRSVKVTKCSLKPVNKTTDSVRDEYYSRIDKFVKVFKPLWRLADTFDEIALHQDFYDIDINIDASSYNSLFDLYYDMILIKNNSSEDEDKNNGYILRYVAYLRAICSILSFRFDYDDEYDDEYDDDEYDD